MGKKVQAANGRLGALMRATRGGKAVETNPRRIAEARDDLLAARVEESIDVALRPEPPYEPLSAKHRTRLAKYLRTGR